MIIGKYFCPDVTEETRKFLTVQNFYNNEKQRISFSVDILKCSDYFKPKGGCKNDTEVDKLFEAIYFNLNILIQTNSFEDDLVSDLQGLITFHSQFQLST